MILRIATLIVGVAIGAGAMAQEVKLAVTTSFHNSGLSEVLLPEIKQDLGLDVHLLVVGTGQAIRLGKAGDVDAILVHSRSAEQAFVEQGFGTHRTEIMYNDFVIVGPGSDPAQLRDANTVVEALQKIHSINSAFVSRGDDSGTHKAEQALWRAAGIDPQDLSTPWYRSAGAGMGAALNVASGMNAYILSDRASWLNFGNKGDLTLLFSGDPGLFNQYAFLPVNPAKHRHVAQREVAKLEAWLTSPRAKTLINGYRLHGEALFFFNAQP
ncbi:extracellular solute-binding protein [Cognatishimia sp. WU-CL00825]|uniref:substrate-binding domain-containing protein n=1 Tax=Cognatishimia sp. WU-CL00825 TaxID=3127658 RepID=UPI00310B9BC7